MKAVSTALNLRRSASLVVPNFGVVAAVLHEFKFAESDMLANLAMVSSRHYEDVFYICCRLMRHAVKQGTDLHESHRQPLTTDQVIYDRRKRTASKNVCRSGRKQLE